MRRWAPLILVAATEHAGTHLREAVRLEPGNEQARLNLARVLIQTGQTNEARQLLSRGGIR